MELIKTERIESTRIDSWDFTKVKPEILQQHMELSIPGYKDGHQIIRIMSHYFIKEGSHIYDIGCGPGSLIEELSEEHSEKTVLRIEGIDPYIEMHEKYYLQKGYKHGHQITFIGDSAEDKAFQECSMAIFYYSLQFMDIDKKVEVLSKITKVLKRGGCVIIFEKVIDENPVIHEMITTSYEQWKLEQGIDEKSIIQKKLSLMGTLKNSTRRELKEMLLDTGVQGEITYIYRYLGFEGLIFVKR
ncbi:MAG TPA: methyltransferase domain-containing protein [Prochlorococcus sp.]|nr:methyltransferase domain-containing protein [Prochlorococcus sp.]